MSLRADGTLTSSEVARRLHISDRAVRYMAEDRKIAYTITPGGHYRFYEYDVERLEDQIGERANDGSNVKPLT